MMADEYLKINLSDRQLRARIRVEEDPWKWLTDLSGWNGPVAVPVEVLYGREPPRWRQVGQEPMLEFGGTATERQIERVLGYLERLQLLGGGPRMPINGLQRLGELPSRCDVRVAIEAAERAFATT